MVVLLEALIVPLLTVGLAPAQFASGINLVEVYATVTDARTFIGAAGALDALGRLDACARVRARGGYYAR
jgi:hypothetical protein